MNHHKSFGFFLLKLYDEQTCPNPRLQCHIHILYTTVFLHNNQLQNITYSILFLTNQIGVSHALVDISNDENSLLALPAQINKAPNRPKAIRCSFKLLFDFDYRDKFALP